MSAFGKSSHSPCTTNLSIKGPISQAKMTSCTGHPQAMLTEIYIETLLISEELADLVWELWNAGVITDELAAMVWGILASGSSGARELSDSVISITSLETK